MCVCVFALLLGARGEGMFGFFLEAGGGEGGWSLSLNPLRLH